MSLEGVQIHNCRFYDHTYLPMHNLVYVFILRELQWRTKLPDNGEGSYVGVMTDKKLTCYVSFHYNF